jgi:DNA-binding transcriptional LysR family regulator
MELRELKAFVAVVEEGGMSAASRRMHVSQPALSQTISSLERGLGVKLLIRSSFGVHPTQAGQTLLAEARSVLARHARAVQAMADLKTVGNRAIRLGIPLELPPSVLPPILARFSRDFPDVRVVPRHFSTAAQFAALRAHELDIALVRERPAGLEFDAMPVVRENLGILIATTMAEQLGRPDGIPLDALRTLEWVGFPRSGSPAWYDELIAIFRTHGVDVSPFTDDEQPLIAAVKLVGVSSGQAFALAPLAWHHPLPDGITWSPLQGNPIIRHTWAVWPAESRGRDIGRLIAAFELTEL